MKKLIVILMVNLLLLSFCSCSSNNNRTDATEPEVEKMTDDEIQAALSDVADDLDYAYSKYKESAAILVDEWTTSSYFNIFFNKHEFETSNLKTAGTDTYSRAQRVWTNYNIADERMTEALETIKTIDRSENTQDYLDAIKNYYTSIDTFKTLVQTWPAGYSKLTYSQALTTAIGDCDKAASELAFY